MRQWLTNRRWFNELRRWIIQSFGRIDGGTVLVPSHAPVCAQCGRTIGKCDHNG